MLPENITCAFKNKASFQKLEIKFGFSYYPGARKKNWDFISNLIARDLSDKIEMYSTHNEGTSAVAQRFIRTLNDKIYNHVTAILKHLYISRLDEVVDKYSKTDHQIIKMNYISRGVECNKKS